MAFSEAVKHPGETFRTDPAGFVGLGIGVALPFVAERARLPNPMRAAFTLGGVSMIAASLSHLENSFNYSRRIEASLHEHGFEQTEFRVRAYCLRQISRVVCEKTGHLEKYEQLCEKTDRLRFTFLPHL